jgi:hypothetical protein
MSRMIRTTFDIVEVRGEKSYKCTCGRRCKRAKKFWQSINPWNKNLEGQVKGPGEIRTELWAEEKAWRAVPDPCNHEEKPK